MKHDLYMQRCLELAEVGLRNAMPNPSVGAVLVYQDRIIGEGFTSPYGGPHGEVNCINSVTHNDRQFIKDSTLYVSLEPCSHYGKTPPCCDLIIAQEIQNIIIGTKDPHSKVAGRGIETLQQAGRNITIGVLEKQCRELNKRFFTFHERQRPYVILKWAQSIDGFLSPAYKDGDRPVWITNQYSRQLVHKWRSEEAAILVGTQTVLDDNPGLDVRNWTGTNPVRVVLDISGKISKNYKVKDEKIRTIVLTEENNLPNLDNLQYITIEFSESLAKNVLNVLYENDVLSVIIEGGRKTLQTFIDAGLWDEARVFEGSISFVNGTPAPVTEGKIISRESIANDQLQIIRNYD